MVVGVVTHLLQVVVFATHTKALLGVGYPWVLHRGVAQDDILELVHTGIGEHQGGVILDDHGCRWHNLVLL